MPKTRPPYDEEFRREAVGLLARGERSLAALSSELGVSQETLRTWRRRAGVEAGKVEGLTRDEREELRRVTTATGAPERRSASARGAVPALPAEPRRAAPLGLD